MEEKQPLKIEDFQNLFIVINSYVEQIRVNFTDKLKDNVELLQKIHRIHEDLNLRIKDYLTDKDDEELKKEFDSTSALELLEDLSKNFKTDANNFLNFGIVLKRFSDFRSSEK